MIPTFGTQITQEEVIERYLLTPAQATYVLLLARVRMPQGDSGASAKANRAAVVGYHRGVLGAKLSRGVVEAAIDPGNLTGAIISAGNGTAVAGYPVGTQPLNLFGKLVRQLLHTGLLGPDKGHYLVLECTLAGAVTVSIQIGCANNCVAAIVHIPDIAGVGA